MLALVDANHMYSNCERAFAPRLRNRPLVVLSSNDGACIARSDEAKALGVKMAQPWFEVRHLEKTAGLIAVSANFELYGDMSSRMMAIEARYAPRQEVYSIVLIPRVTIDVSMPGDSPRWRSLKLTMQKAVSVHSWQLRGKHQAPFRAPAGLTGSSPGPDRSTAAQAA